MNILGYTIQTSIDDLDFSKKQILVSTINPHSYCVAKNDHQLSNALQKSDILLPDGIGVVWANRILNKTNISRIAGSDLHYSLLAKLNKSNGKAFYLGSGVSTLQKIKTRLKQEYPNIQFGGYSPPFKPEFSEEENREMIAAVNAFQPHVLFVGMTAPKQEKWAYQHKEQLDTNIIASVGAVFDFFAGTVKRPGKFWQKAGLEWLPRLLREPKRLWRRNFISTPRFLWDVFKAKLGW